MSLCPNKPKAEQAEKPTPFLRFFREVKSQDKPFPTLERQADRENYTQVDGSYLVALSLFTLECHLAQLTTVRYPAL